MINIIETELSISVVPGHSLFARELISDQNAEAPYLVLVVHGGPGLADHSESLPGLRNLLGYYQNVPASASLIHGMLFYDQLGCGKSDQPPTGLKLYSLEHYVQELAQVVEYCQKRHPSRKICVLGHSWGGQVVSELLLRQGTRYMDCAVISNAPLDESTYERKQQALRNALDPDTRAFYEQEEVELESANELGFQILFKLIGKSDTNITGEMKGWEILSRVQQDMLHVPCLFLCTKDDTVPHEDYERVQNGGLLPTFSRVVIMEEGGHGPFFGDSATEYFQHVYEFLQSTLDSRK
jgi:pimeloyl-ACP methyl ester carboxylesterase